MKRFNKFIAMVLVFVILFTSQAVTSYASAVSEESITQDETVEVKDETEVVEEEQAAIEETTKVPEDTAVAGDAATEVTEQKTAVGEEETTEVPEETAAEEETTTEVPEETAVEEETTTEAKKETTTGVKKETTEVTGQTSEVVDEVETEPVQEVPDFDIQYVYVESNELVAPGTQNILISADADITNLEEVKLIVSKDGQLESSILVNKTIENLLLFTKEYQSSETGNYKVLSITYKINGESYTYNIEENVTFSVKNENAPELGIFGTLGITDSEFENSVISTETEITPDEVESAITNSEEIIKETETSEGINISKADNVSKVVNSGGVSIKKNVRNLLTSTTGSKIVIVLDPGHGGTESGASYGNLLEKNLNLDIARYAKAELEKYPGVTVYLTRNSDTNVGLYDRANYAKSVGATALVSIHNNAASKVSANGAEVYVTAYSKYNASSTVLATLILTELSKVGLSNRGVKINNDDHNNGHYDDGTWKDDLAVIRQSILNGIPAILVEHAFMSNSGDYSLLASQEKLKEMGVADATAIAEHYGLSKELPLPTASSLVVSNVNAMNGTFDVTLSGIVSSSGINQVRVPIWTQGDQSDIFWYTGTRQNDGSYIVHVDNANHRYNYGAYNIHAYIIDGLNRNTMVQSTTNILRLPTNIPPVSITVAGDSTQTSYSLKAANVFNGQGVRSVNFAVWSKTGGQDDIVWYGGTKDSVGAWNSTAKINYHRTSGLYYVHVYAYYANGTSKLLGTSSFNVTAPSATEITVTNVNNGTGTFDVVIKGINTVSGVNRVQVPVWSKSNQSDIYWYTATRQGDGSYIANVNIANHNYNYGTYTIHSYIESGNGVYQFLKDTKTTIKVPSAVISARGNSTETSYSLSASNIPLGKGFKNVKFAVWSKTGGQDDAVWYGATRNATGTWTGTATISNHKTAGLYYVHAYAEFADGTSKFIGDTQFNVKIPTATEISIKNLNSSAGTFDVILKGVSSISGVNYVQIPVWSKSNQSDIYWYRATRQGDGSYIARVNIANHNYNYGYYNVHAYVLSGNGINAFVKGTTASIHIPSAVITANGDSAQTSYSLNATNIPYGSAVRNVKFAVWSKAGGQDDAIWYNGTRNANGTWSAVATINNHKTAGLYYVHVYADLINGNNKFLGDTTFNVTIPTATGISVANINSPAGTYDVILKGISSVSGVSRVLVPVWSQGNQSDIYWYTATRQGDGSYLARVDIANHNYNYGSYIAHAYVVSGNGINAFVKGTTASIQIPIAKISATGNANQTLFSTNAVNVPYGSGVKNVKFAVWSQAGGQDDCIWYNGIRNANGSWSSSVNISNHKTAGLYYVHTYAELVNGTNKLLGTTNFNITGPSISKVELINKDEANGSFQVRVSGVKSNSGISKVQIPVWCASNQSDIVWYTATKVSEDTYVAYADVRNHNNNLGNYIAHVYIEDSNGIRLFGGGINTQILNVSSLNYLITGSTLVTASQLVNYYNANALYPDYYANSDAPSIGVFAQIYIEESNAEGIKAEVAFAQAMKETNFLRYTGTVNIAQYNFAGIGATGNGVVGNSFSSVREGIRAQIQHLKAYASTEPLNNPCVDPRFRYVSRGTAPYVEWLGIKENPYGKGWATAVKYGYSIISDYIAKILKH